MDSKNKILTIEKAAAIFLCTIFLIGGIIFGYINAEIKNYSGISNLRQFQPSMPTRLYDVNGELIAELFVEKRELVSYEDLPGTLINAFIAVEDSSFYHHHGIDYKAIFRAMVRNVGASIQHRRPVIVQGGSTITQQLAKRLFTGGEKTFARKALEAVLALQIEKKFSKEEILEMYFNQIYLGHGCHGIATAARFFFDKEVSDLTVAESSVLAALPSRPNTFSPLRNPRGAYVKNRDTLRRMVANGFISREEADRISREFWSEYLISIRDEFPTKTVRTRHHDKAPHFTEYVRQILLAHFGSEFLYNEGLKVYTTLDLRRQEIGEQYLREGVDRQDEVSSRISRYSSSAVDRELIEVYSNLSQIFSLPGLSVRRDIESKFRKAMADDVADVVETLSLFVDAPAVTGSIKKYRDEISTVSTSMRVEGAFIVIEPQTGYITTMVGGSDFGPGNMFNRAVQARRQPGSAFKPFVYGPGIEMRKMTTGTYFPDVPIMDIHSSGDVWSPVNYEGSFLGMVPVSRALASSINIISVRVYDLLGPDPIVDFASRMLKAPSSRFHPGPALSLGVTEVTPLEMATAYAIFANQGRDVLPFAIRYVTDSGGNEILNIEEEVGRALAYKEMNDTIQVIPEEVAWIMTNLMKRVIERGTPTRTIREEAGFRKEAAGKTGTTTNWADAWFCGYTEHLAAVAWVGYDRPFMSMGRHQAGAAVAAPIWGKYMREVYNGMPDPSFPSMPRGVARYDEGYGLPGAVKQHYDEAEMDGIPLEMESIFDAYLQDEDEEDAIESE